MNRLENRALDILRELGRRPAVPFYEDGPADYIFGALSDIGLSPFIDDFGNLIARYSNSSSSCSDDHSAPIAFVAHMDHPGFELVEADASAKVDTGGIDGYVAVALGGVPEVSLSRPADVLIVLPDGVRLPATAVPLDADSRRVRIEMRAEIPAGVSIVPPAPVVFDLPDFELDGGLVRMRALDDLAGCAATLAAMEQLAADDAIANVYAVFTRAEEGGLFGARLMAQAQTLPLDTLIVSIESSPLIPGVEQGAGPVIRTGDALYTFDAEAEQALVAARESIRRRNADFRCQRQLMSGGVCEATAFAVWGYRATGMAFPLGNYHNATTSIRDPESGIGAEYIRVEDFLGGVELLAEAAAVAAIGDRISTPAKERVREVPDDIRRRMMNSAPLRSHPNRR